MENKKPITINIISINSDTSLAPCIFSMVGAEEFDIDTDGITALNPYNKNEYIPEDGDIIIEVLDQDGSGWKTALASNLSEDAEKIFEYLSTIFKNISLYKIKITNPNDFYPFRWEDYSETIFEKHQHC